jgi:multiple sugar transport system permease protein
MIDQVNTPIKAVSKPATSTSNYRLKAQVIAYLFLLPALLVFAFVNWYPMALTIINSFQKVTLTGATEWVGLRNYVRMFGNPMFATAWKNVLGFGLLSVLMGFMVPVIVALMMNEVRGRLSGFFRGIVYLPVLIPIAVALLVWRHIYNPDAGILNRILETVGIPGQRWLQNPDLAKPAIVVIMTWLGAGSTVLIYLSALQEIPTEIYEASEVDGFSILQRVWYLTLPLIRARMLILLLLQLIAVAQVFTEPYILTAGGPANSTFTPVLEIYRTAFDRSDFGLAAAWSVSMLVTLSVISTVYVWLQYRRQSVR